MKNMIKAVLVPKHLLNLLEIFQYGNEIIYSQLDGIGDLAYQK